MGVKIRTEDGRGYISSDIPRGPYRRLPENLEYLKGYQAGRESMAHLESSVITRCYAIYIIVSLAPWVVYWMRT